MNFPKIPILLAILGIQAARAEPVAMWQSSAASSHDTFITTHYNEYVYSVGIGFSDQGVAFWLPCAQGVAGPDGQPGTETQNLDYPSWQPVGFSCAQPFGTVPFYRFYMGTPATDHFYTSSVAEARQVEALGYQYEGVEGFIYSTSAAGRIPLYRLSACWNSACSDVEHRYTISNDTKNTLMANGWTLDSIAGYVFDGFNNAYDAAKFNGTLNGYSVTSNSVINVPLQNVTPPSGTFTLSGLDRNAKGFLISNSTARPAGATQQRIAFTLNTGGLFDTGTNLDHIPTILYYHAPMGTDGVPIIPYDGIGVFFSTPNWNCKLIGTQCGVGYCGSAASTGGQVFVELYGRVNGATEVATNQFDCASNLAQPLASNHSYDVTITASDGAVLSVSIADHATHQPLTFANGTTTFSKSYAFAYSCPLTHTAGTLATGKLYCNNPFTMDHFPIARTGYALWPLFLSTGPDPNHPGAGVGSYSGFVFHWLDKNGVVL